MYGQILSATAPAAAAGAVAALPVTGSNELVSIALAVAAGMLTWGALYMKRASK
jgi:hypothetical protein